MLDLEFQSQKTAKESLVSAKDSDRHSILIAGMSGCGKTYLSKYYAELLGIEDFALISSTVDSIRSTIDESLESRNRVVICIENLDTGVKGASYTILKFLEEPKSNIYIVITVQNINNVPDTIISRSFVIDVHSPLQEDLLKYANYKYADKIKFCSKSSVWDCAKSFTDIDTICNMTQDNLKYFNELKTLFNFRDNVSIMSWRMQHYLDNSETPLDLVMQYVIYYAPTNAIRLRAVQCANDLRRGTIAKHIVIGKFLMNSKYAE